MRNLIAILAVAAMLSGCAGKGFMGDRSGTKLEKSPCACGPLYGVRANG